MSGKNLRSPEESWDAVKKDTTRHSDAAGDKNKQKPDEIKAKGEITPRVEESEEEAAEE